MKTKTIDEKVAKIAKDEEGKLIVIGPEIEVPVSRLQPNKYNYKEMSTFMLDTLKRAIDKQGFIFPIIARSGNANGPFKDKRLEIIDGEHRYKAAVALQLSHVIIKDLGNVPDEVAKTLTVSLNEIHGTSRPDDLAKIIKDLDKTPEMLSYLPFDDVELEAMQASSEDDLKKLEELSTRPGQDGAPDLETSEETGDELTAEEDDVASFFGLYDLSPDESKALRKRAEKLARRLKWKDKTPGSLLAHLLTIGFKSVKKKTEEATT
jgi:ParB-like chromosome segregation protein Spo0J